MEFTSFSVKKVFISLWKASFFRNVLVIMSGTAVAQILGFALTPFISRLFTPTDFGVFGSFNAVLGVVSAGVTLDYSQAIMLPKKKEEAINLFMLSFLCTALITLCAVVVSLIIPTYIQNLIKAPYGWTLPVLIIAILVSGINQSCQAWCVRCKAFKHTSASQVVRSVSSNGIQIGLGYLKVGPAGLIVSRVLADVFASLNLVRVLLPDLGASWHRIGWDRMKRLAKEYRDFPTYSASQNVINSLSSRMPVLLLSQFYGLALAGAYSFGMRIIETPMGFVLTALRQVLFQKAAETQHHGGKLLPLYIKITFGLFALILLPCLLFFIWSSNIFVWLFGSQWYMAGELARSLMLWLMFAFCNLPAVLFAKIMRMQRFVFFYDLCLLAARTLALVLGGLFLGASNTVLLFAVVGAVMNFILITRVGYSVMKQDRDVVQAHA